MTPDPLQSEAEMLAARSSLERADYLFEVAHIPGRGPEAAERLQRMVLEIHKDQAEMLDARPALLVGDFLT